MPEAPNIAREIVLGTGMSVHTDAYSVSRACATSFRAIANVAESIMAGSISVGIAGGADSSSVLPIGVSKALARTLVDVNKARTLSQRLKLFSRLKFRDLMPVPPAVAEYSTGLRMGDTAEQMAKSHGITREAQDALAHRSHELAAKARQQGWLRDEVMTAYVPPYRAQLSEDNNIRKDSSGVLRQAEAGVRSQARQRYRGQQHAADRRRGGGADDERVARQRAGVAAAGLFAQLRLRRHRRVGRHAAGAFLRHAAGAGSRRYRLADLTLIDMHEAFAAQTLANLKMFASEEFAREKLGRSRAIGEVDMDKFNVRRFHRLWPPFAATGARMITQTLHELKRRGGGLA